LINFGILPLTFTNPADYDKIDQQDELEITTARNNISESNDLLVQNKTKGTSFSVACQLSARQKQIILAGGALNVRT
jgi:aconitate hydratase